MGRVWSPSLLLSVILVAVVSQDFQDNTGGFEFIYHENHNLMLTIYNHACYYGMVPQKEHDTIDTALSKNSLENQVRRLVMSRDASRIAPSSLGEMRDEYQDGLADYHCTGKDIYTLQMFKPVKFTCDFESSNDPFCGFAGDSTDDFGWHRHSGGTGTSNTGPSWDHTLGHGHSGHFMYTEASNHHAGDESRMKLHVSAPEYESVRCLHFFYHMYGSGIGTLNVYAAKTSSGHLPAPLWTMSGSHGSSWREAQVTIPITTDFVLTMEAVRGSNSQGDIAFDDISILEGSCTSPTSTHAPATTTKASSSHTSTTTHTPTQSVARLVGGSSNTSGLLEVYRNGHWHTVCGHFSDTEAKVACGMLGITGGEPSVLHERNHDASVNQLSEDFDCTGHETSLFSCRTRTHSACSGHQVHIGCGDRCHNVNGRYWLPDGASQTSWHNYCRSGCTCKDGHYSCTNQHSCSGSSASAGSGFGAFPGFHFSSSHCCRR